LKTTLQQGGFFILVISKFIDDCNQSINLVKIFFQKNAWFNASKTIGAEQFMPL